MSKRYEVIERDTGQIVGLFNKQAIKTIGFSPDYYIVRDEEKAKTEAAIVKQEGKF